MQNKSWVPIPFPPLRVYPSLALTSPRQGKLLGTPRILPWVFEDLRKNTSSPDQPFVWEFTALRGFARECAVFTPFSMQKRAVVLQIRGSGYVLGAPETNVKNLNSHTNNVRKKLLLSRAGSEVPPKTLGELWSLWIFSTSID